MSVTTVTTRGERVWAAEIARIAAVVLLVVPTSALAQGLIIPGGFDLFQTQPGAYFDLELPEGFFGTVGNASSDALTARVDLRGERTGDLGYPGNSLHLDLDHDKWAFYHGLHPVFTVEEPFDTDSIVQRLTDVVLPSVGDTGTAEVQMVSLSLVSIEPTPVTYGGENTQFFDVTVDLVPNVDQGIGAMVFTRQGLNSGIVETQFPIDFRLTFENRDLDGPQAAERLLLHDELRGTGTFTVIPEASSGLMMLCGMMACVMWGHRSRP